MYFLACNSLYCMKKLLDFFAQICLFFSYSAALISIHRNRKSQFFLSSLAPVTKFLTFASQIANEILRCFIYARIYWTTSRWCLVIDYEDSRWFEYSLPLINLQWQWRKSENCFLVLMAIYCFFFSRKPYDTRLTFGRFVALLFQGK